jgi:gluconate 2-dehydrogenase gamma chain
MPNVTRRDLLAGTALVLLHDSVARGGVIAGHLPWSPGALQPVEAPSTAGRWSFFTDAEAAMVGALADRIIPPDADTPGGREAGCAVYLDRQLAGAYGRSEGLYVQGPESPATPAKLYRSALAALENHCKSLPGAPSWVSLSAAQQDEILRHLEDGSLSLSAAGPAPVDAKHFFETMMKDLQQGFFADPVYGGNRDMCAWKMIGFPGARYDYRDWVGRHNERYPHGPVSIMGSPDWNPTRS